MNRLQLDKPFPSRYGTPVNDCQKRLDQRHPLGAVKNRNYAVPHPTIKVKCAVRCGKFLPAIMRQMCGDFFEICAGIVRFS